VLRRVLRAESWLDRAAELGRACEALARMHNALGLTAPLSAKLTGFHTRPFRVIRGDAFAGALRARIADPAVQRIAARTMIGSVDQWSDSTDLVEAVDLRLSLRRVYM
jgi:hypothetical protein